MLGKAPRLGGAEGHRFPDSPSHSGTVSSGVENSPYSWIFHFQNEGRHPHVLHKQGKGGRLQTLMKACSLGSLPPVAAQKGQLQANGPGYTRELSSRGTSGKYCAHVGFAQAQDQAVDPKTSVTWMRPGTYNRRATWRRGRDPLAP